MDFDEPFLTNRAPRLPLRAVVLLLVLLGWLGAPCASEYYVSPGGRDDASGTSAKDPWRTVRRVNEHLRTHGLKPGDAILFQGGRDFEGGLILEQCGGGTKSQPVRIGTYGRGRATLRPGAGTGVLMRETPWVAVSNLVLVGTPSGEGDGIRADRIRETGTAIPGLAVVDCEARGFAWHGIMIDASQRSRGYEHVRIERCLALGNRHAGIMVYGGNPTERTWRPHARVIVQDCVAQDNAGDPAELRHHSGSGILLDGVDSGVVRRCVALNNGGECRNERGGPVGIWTHASRDIVIEHCEAYANQSCLHDGGGFDLDAGSEDCVMRFNFSHHNHGPGFLVYTYSGASYSDRSNRIYGNISWNDGSPATGYGGIQIGSESGCRVVGLHVHHNTVLAPPRSVAALKVMGHSIQALISSNLVVAASHGALVSISGYDHSVRFEGNRYWRKDGVPVCLVDSQWVVPSFDSWRNATGPDFRFAAAGDLFADPGLTFSVPKDRRASPPVPIWPELRMATRPWIGAPMRPPAEPLSDPGD